MPKVQSFSTYFLLLCTEYSEVAIFCVMNHSPFECEHYRGLFNSYSDTKLLTLVITLNYLLTPTTSVARRNIRQIFKMSRR